MNMSKRTPFSGTLFKKGLFFFLFLSLLIEYSSAVNECVGGYSYYNSHDNHNHRTTNHDYNSHQHHHHRNITYYHFTFKNNEHPNGNHNNNNHNAYNSKS
ncbi:unnamed protein product [Merluccius merluccius]